MLAGLSPEKALHLWAKRARSEHFHWLDSVFEGVALRGLVLPSDGVSEVLESRNSESLVQGLLERGVDVLGLSSFQSMSSSITIGSPWYRLLESNAAPEKIVALYQQLCSAIDGNDIPAPSGQWFRGFFEALKASESALQKPSSSLVLGRFLHWGPYEKALGEKWFGLCQTPLSKVESWDEKVKVLEQMYASPVEAIFSSFPQASTVRQAWDNLMVLDQEKTHALVAKEPALKTLCWETLIGHQNVAKQGWWETMAPALLSAAQGSASSLPPDALEQAIGSRQPKLIESLLADGLSPFDGQTLWLSVFRKREGWEPEKVLELIHVWKKHAPDVPLFEGDAFQKMWQHFYGSWRTTPELVLEVLAAGAPLPHLESLFGRADNKGADMIHSLAREQSLAAQLPQVSESAPSKSTPRF